MNKETINKIIINIKRISIVFFDYLKIKSLYIINYTKNKIILISKGQENFNKLIYLWGFTPALIIALFYQRKLNLLPKSIFSFLIFLFLLIYFTWHIFAIRKTLKVHPENKVVKIKKKDLYKDKTEEEIEEIKKQKKKERIEKFLLLRSWSSTPNYVLIGFLDFYVILNSIQYLLFFFK